MASLNRNFSDLEWGTYELAYNLFSNEIRHPDLLLFLDIEPRIAKERLEGRNRSAEEGIPIKYYEQLQKGYLDLLADIEHSWPNTEVRKVGWNTDFLPIDNILYEIKKRFDVEPKTNQKMLRNFFNE